jgi:hypothetical protein
VDGADQLRAYLATQRRDDFLRQFSRKLLGYSLGRAVQTSDLPLLDQMVRQEGGQIGDLVEQIVRSPQFREVRGTAIAAGQ